MDLKEPLAKSRSWLAKFNFNKVVRVVLMSPASDFHESNEILKLFSSCLLRTPMSVSSSPPFAFSVRDALIPFSPSLPFFAVSFTPFR